MRSYHVTASSATRFEYGIELHAGLMQFPETAAAADEVLAINNALQTQLQKRIGLLVPVVKARATLRFSEYHVDSVLRSAFRAAQVLDGGRSGRITLAVFPNGLRPVTRPVGKSQVKPTKEVIQRLVSSKAVGIEAYRSIWLPKLESALGQLETAIAAHETASNEHKIAFAEEQALREAHHATIDKVMGMVRAAFPRDRKLQDVIFPLLQRARASASEQNDTPETNPAEPKTTPAP